MKTIDIIFTRSKKKMPILSWAIMLWLFKPYSHVSKRILVSNEVLYYQSSESQVNYEHSTVFNKKHKIIKAYSIPVVESIYADVKIECLRQSGIQYGVMQNIGIALVGIASMFGIKCCNPFKEGMNCSELLYVAVFKKLIPELDYNPDTITPKDIENIIHEYFQGDKYLIFGKKIK